MSVESFHDPQFNIVRSVAHDFVVHDLRLTPAPVENFALMRPETFATLRKLPGSTIAGEYDPATNTAILEQARDNAGPLTTATRNVSSAVHEITHSVNGTSDPNAHLFFREALAGLAEAQYLEKRAMLGNYRPASDFILERAGVRVWLPGTFRYLDRREAASMPAYGPTAYSSQGLIAALGIAHVLPSVRISKNTLLGMSNNHSYAAYGGMRHALGQLHPSIETTINRLPQTSDGIMQATALIQRFKFGPQALNSRRKQLMLQ